MSDARDSLSCTLWPLQLCPHPQPQWQEQWKVKGASCLPVNVVQDQAEQSRQGQGELPPLSTPVYLTY